MSLLWSRLNKSWFVAAIAVGMAVSLGQIIVNCYTGMANIDSPYTRWLSINTDSSATTIFFILLPFLASIPAGNMLKEDLDSGLFNKFKLQVPVARLIMQYAAMAFMTGFVTIMIPMLFNLLGYLLILPNFKPDNLLNINIGVFNFNTMLVSLYYSHPFVHACLNILLASVWGGLFSVFVLVNSVWIRNRFASLSTALVLELILMELDAVLPIDDMPSISPTDFLPENGSRPLLWLTALMTIALAAYCMGMYKLACRRAVM